MQYKFVLALFLGVISARDFQNNYINLDLTIDATEPSAEEIEAKETQLLAASNDKKILEELEFASCAAGPECLDAFETAMGQQFTTEKDRVNGEKDIFTNAMNNKKEADEDADVTSFEEKIAADETYLAWLTTHQAAETKSLTALKQAVTDKDEAAFNKQKSTLLASETEQMVHRLATSIATKTVKLNITKAKVDDISVTQDDVDALQKEINVLKALHTKYENLHKTELAEANKPNKPVNNPDKGVKDSGDGAGDEGSGVGGIVAGIIGGIVVLGAAGYCMWKRKQGSDEGGKRERFVRDALV